MPAENSTATTSDPTKLIDRAAIAQADRVRSATLTRDADARCQLGVAEAVLRRATEAADAAAAAGFDLRAEQAVAEAELTLRAMTRVAMAASAAASDAPRLHRAAVGEAHAIATRAAVACTLQAHRAAAEATQTIASAELRVQSLQILINTFFNAGAQVPSAAANRPGLLRDVGDEVQFWRASGFTFPEDAQ